MMCVGCKADPPAVDSPRPGDPSVLDGDQAFRLVSLLVSGNGTVRTALVDQRQTRIVINELMVLQSATNKYDAASPMFALRVYSAKGRIGGAAEFSPIGEATALWSLLSDAGVRPNGAMEGSYLELRTLECAVNTTADVSSARRFHCTLVGGP